MLNPFTMPQHLFIKLYRCPIHIVQEILIPEIEPHVRVGRRTTFIPIHVRVSYAFFPR